MRLQLVFVLDLEANLQYWRWRVKYGDAAFDGSATTRIDALRQRKVAVRRILRAITYQREMDAA